MLRHKVLVSSRWLFLPLFYLKISNNQEHYESTTKKISEPPYISLQPDNERDAHRIRTGRP